MRVFSPTEAPASKVATWNHRPTRYRILRVFLPSLLTILTALVAICFYLSYLLLYPKSGLESETPSSYLLPYQDLTIQVPGGALSVWFIPGLKGAPVVFLGHDYMSNRVALMNLAALLREAGYNVAMIPFRAHGMSEFPRSTLGLGESGDLARAVEYVFLSAGVDESRAAVYGVGLGAHTSIRTALGDDRIQVLVLDSPYPAVNDLIAEEINRRLGFSSSVFRGAVGVIVTGSLLESPSKVFDDLDVKALFPRRVLFIAGLDAPVFARWTRQLYAEAEGQKDILILPKTRRSILLTSELQDYDRQVVRYLQKALPL